jgi:hypothetical protein
MLRRQAGISVSNRQVRCGAVSFVQRFGDALNLKFFPILLQIMVKSKMKIQQK